jgi:transposase InsO family protein
MRIKYKATTYSNHNFKVVPNLLKQDFNVEVPKTVYADDITYIATDEGWEVRIIYHDDLGAIEKLVRNLRSLSLR